MDDGAFLRDLLFNFVHEEGVGVVVFLQELEVESVSDLSGQDLLELPHPGFLLMLALLTLEVGDDFVLEGLVFFVTDVEGDLVGDEVVVIIIDELPQQDGRRLRQPQEELALANLEIVKVSSLLVLIYSHEEPEDLVPEAFVLDVLLSQSEGIPKFLFHIVALLYPFLDLVQPPAFNGNPNSLLVLLVEEASVEHFVDYVLHLGLDHHLFFLLVVDLHTLLSVRVNAFVDQGLHILRLF